MEATNTQTGWRDPRCTADHTCRRRDGVVLNGDNGTCHKADEAEAAA